MVQKSPSKNQMGKLGKYSCQMKEYHTLQPGLGRRWKWARTNGKMQEVVMKKKVKGISSLLTFRRQKSKNPA